MTLVRMMIPVQEVPDPATLESPLPGGLASVVRFFLNFPQPLQIAGVVVGVVIAAVLAFVVWRRRRPIWTWLKTRPRLVYAWAAGVGVFLAVAGVGAGAWGYDYVQHDNGFCTGCHVMGSSFVRFTESEHSQLECHDCHQQPMTASLRQLYLWVVERPQDIGEHSPVATSVCAECHIQDDPEETWEAIASTQGHDVHLNSDSTALADVQCVTCHGQEVHRFLPAEETCAQSACHAVEDTRVVLGEMAGAETAFHCLGCHQFTAPLPVQGPIPTAASGLEGRMVPDADTCGGCHEMQPLIAEFTPEADPHRSVCGACHNPHEQTTPAAAFDTCTSAGCHSAPEETSPFHRGLEDGVVQVCETCHSAHLWVVDADDCAGCHTTLSE
jgi:hypothetical protein